MHLELYLIFKTIHFIQCYDVEIDAVIRTNEELINQLTNFQQSNLDPKHQIEVKIPNALWDVLDDILSKHPILRRTSNSSYTQEAFYPKFVEHLKKKGVERLVVASKRISKQLDTDQNFTSQLTIATFHYLESLKKHVNAIVKEAHYSDVDKELMLLDLVHTSNTLMNGEKKKLLNIIADSYNNVTEVKVNNAAVQLYENNKEETKEDLKYLCDNVKLCRPFPAFSDYLAELCSEILKFSNSKFRLFVMELRETFKKYNIRKCFKLLLGSKMVRYLGSDMEHLLKSNLTEVRDMVSVVRGMLTKRHTWVPSDDDKLKARTKATRILIDIVDLALAADGEDTVAIQFDKMARAVRELAADIRTDTQPELSKFIQYAIKTLYRNLDDLTKQEVRVLVEIIWKGQSDDTELAGYIFAHGSRYLQ